MTEKERLERERQRLAKEQKMLERFSAGRPEALREEEEERRRRDKEGGLRMFVSGGQSASPKTLGHTDGQEKQREEKSPAMESFGTKMKDMKENVRKCLESQKLSQDKSVHDR